MTDTTSYTDAVNELEKIIASLNADKFNVDELADRVKRAHHLINLCKERIEQTELEINQLVTSFDDESETPSNNGHEGVEP